MSSISITTAPSIDVRPSTRLRLTTRGRRVLLALASVPLAAGIAFAALGGGIASASGETVATEFETVTVLPGDTLWAIADRIAPHADPRDVIHEIRTLNALSTDSLQVGQQIALPAAYTR